MSKKILIIEDDKTSVPTIKGIFVNSHIKAVEDKFGKEGLMKLQKLFGKSLKFKNTDNVPVRDEVSLIECALIVLSGNKTSKENLIYDAGKLHFRNFSTTPLGKIIFSVFKKNYKLMMLQTHNIAGHVFRGVKFTSYDLGGNSVKVIMENNDYPLDHFRGLFQAWMEFAGYKGIVTGTVNKSNPNTYEYVMTWE